MSEVNIGKYRFIVTNEKIYEKKNVCNLKRNFNDLQNINNNFKVNLSTCFDIINETTIEKKSFFYSKNFSTELCLKTAISQKYKEDIYNQKYFHKCFPLCNSCSSYSTKSSDMKCISCLKGFILDDNGNCYINKKYNEIIRKKELSTIFNTLNSYNYINTNYTKKSINGITYLFKEKNKTLKHKRKLFQEDDFDDFSNNIINRESQSSLTNDKTNCEYNFHIELSPYYALAEICISKGKNFIENNRCVDSCTPQLETYFHYPVVEIKVGPGDSVTVCDCSFRCCKKRINKLAKSLDRGFIDGSYQYFRRQDGTCLYYEDGNYYDRGRKNSYLLAQDFVPCFFPIYNDDNEIEYFISGYGKTIVGNNCLNRCPIDDINQYYYYNPSNSRCYKCPENCIECNNIPTNGNGYCTRCKEGFNIIFNGFCYDICPPHYGEDSGNCRPCYSSEIYIEGKCVVDNGASYNYGNSTNPSFKDEHDDKIFHKCIEYIGNFTYAIAQGQAVCPSSMTCPDFCYEGGDGLCHECPKGCVSCTWIDGVFCHSCKEGYLRNKINSCEERKCDYIVEGNTGCFNECPEGYFYVDREDDSETFECIHSCNNAQNQYYETITNKCKARCISDDSSVIEAENLCLEQCDKNYPENVDGICVNCALNSQYNNNGSCVLKEDNFDEIYYILSGAENVKYNKVGSCYIIDELGDYHPEHIKSREYNPSLCPNDCPSNFIKILDENNQIVCLKCYDTCETCEHTGVAGNHKCTQCKDGYEFSSRLYGVCDKKCDNGDYYYFEKNREKKCVNRCPEEYPFLAENEDPNINNYECIKNCTDNNQLLINETFTCVIECPVGYSKYELLCVIQCPELYGTYKDSNECIICKDHNLHYYNGKCYKADEEIPLDTYVPNGSDEDKILYECFRKRAGEEDAYLTGYYATKNNCSKLCPEDYHYDTDNSVCIKCETGCLYCDPVDGCKNDGCPSDYYTVMDEDFNLKCAPECPTQTPVIDTGNFCLESCGDGQLKIIVSGDENIGNANYECTDDRCKSFNLFLNPSSSTCYEPQSIPNETYYNPDKQNDNENQLDPCLIQILENEYFTGFFLLYRNVVSNAQIIIIMLVIINVKSVIFFVRLVLVKEITMKINVFLVLILKIEY